MLLERLQKLGNAASWDSCGGVKQKSMRKSKIPASYASFVHDCSNTTENCKLMKVLQSNKCIHDCRYCINSSCSRGKAELAPIELAKSFNSMQKSGFVQGLFLSSAVTGEADRTAEKMIESASILRKRFGFQGYIHLKVLPTMSKHLIFEMAKIANRLSLNLEVPSKSHFQLLGNTKDYCNDLEKRLRWVNETKRKGILRSFTTQFILGAAEETDAEVLSKMDDLYHKTDLYRTYFSAFTPIKGTALEGLSAESPSREHLLYQSDWLLRVYKFKLKEIKLGLQENGNFENVKDVKFEIALHNPNLFPVDVNYGSEEELLQVPGIGPKTVLKIVQRRQEKKFADFRDLKRTGLILKRAQSFIQLDGQRQRRISDYIN